MVLANLRYYILFLLLTVAGPVSAAVSALKDPTQPTPIIGDAATGAMRVDMIFAGKDATTIIINGKPYRIGDTVNGYKITKVEQSRVYLNSSGHQITLTLFPST